MQHPNFETRHPLQTDEQQETGFDPLNNFNKNRSSTSTLRGTSQTCIMNNALGVLSGEMYLYPNTLSVSATVGSLVLFLILYPISRHFLRFKLDISGF